jgi:hypothetical protein
VLRWLAERGRVVDLDGERPAAELLAEAVVTIAATAPGWSAEGESGHLAEHVAGRP